MAKLLSKTMSFNDPFLKAFGEDVKFKTASRLVEL